MIVDSSTVQEAPTLLDSFLAVRDFTEKLAAPLSPEDCVVQSMTEASPAKWQLAHTTWFFETFVLEPLGKEFQPSDPDYRVLYNSYYNAVGEQYPRRRRGLVTRPSLAEVLEYRERITEAVGRHLQSGAIQVAELADVVELGIHHEQQHQELMLTDVKHLLGLNPVRGTYDPDLPESEPAGEAPAGWRRRDAGLVSIGHEGPEFSFDNEGPRHTVWLDAFELADRPVTVGEYLEFMADGGYRRPEFWLSDGWATVQSERWQAPLYWRSRDDDWEVFTLGGLRELRRDEPVSHISFYEADAFATWAGARLPTEDEWEIASRDVSLEGNYVESGMLHPEPASGDGLVGMMGNLWEWTASPYAPYPGFRAAEGALGEYNGKFMSNQMVLRGGSCATSRTHIRRTYRNFFYPDARWQFTGIRLARDVR